MSRKGIIWIIFLPWYITLSHGSRIHIYVGWGDGWRKVGGCFHLACYLHVICYLPFQGEAGNFVIGRTSN